jgi:hypothetical protein
MSKTITNKDLKAELEFIPEETQVFCRGLWSEGELYGYQLFFINNELNEIAKIFIGKIKLSGE